MKYMNKSISAVIAFLAVIFFLVSFPLTSSAQTLYSCQTSDGGTAPFLHTINANTGVTITTENITLAGETVRGCNGLAKDPETGVCYMIVNVAADPGTPSPRILATINVDTGVATEIGNTGLAFASIAFASDGTLYGVTGDGASLPETLFTIDRRDGSTTLITALGNGDDGEVIGFNPDDGLLYHASGIVNINVDNIFESINPNTLVINPINISGDIDDYEEQLAMVYEGGNSFLISNRNPLFLHSITTTGVVSDIGPMDHGSKGLAFDCGIPDPVNPVTEVPTISEWGLIVMAGVLGIIGFMVIRRRKVVA